MVGSPRSLQEGMKALVYSDFGGSDRFSIADREMPHIGPDTVLVKVAAAGINPVDYKIREGYLQGLLDVDLPAVPGWDVAGVVEKAGLDTPEFEVGDRIVAYARADVVHHGTVAEFAPVPVRTAAKVPDGVTFAQAAALPLAGLTALQTIERSGLGEGDTVLVHNAAGGVGSFGVQLARLRGARVIGTASTGKHDYLRSLGAEPVEYGDAIVEQVTALAPHGIDVVLDYAGGDALDSTPRLLRDGGYVVSIADPRARTEFGGTYAWVRPDAEQLGALVQLVADGALQVDVTTFPFAQAVEAYRELEGGHARGKIVVTL